MKQSETKTWLAKRVPWMLATVSVCCYSSLAIADGSDAGVCAQVRLRISQTAIITRTGFLGDLEVKNSFMNSRLDHVGGHLYVTRSLESGAPLSNPLFSGSDAPLVTGLDSSGNGSLAPGGAAQLKWTLVPSRDAASSGSTQYYVGGTLSYDQGGSHVDTPLYPGLITVKPDANLHVRYFYERDIYGDDPFTSEVEPAVPYSLGIMITNDGLGGARNVQITSAQPRIIDNAKQLLVDFKIIGTQVGADPVNPSLTANMGTRRSTWGLWALLPRSRAASHNCRFQGYPFLFS